MNYRCWLDDGELSLFMAEAFKLVKPDHWPISMTSWWFLYGDWGFPTTSVCSVSTGGRLWRGGASNACTFEVARCRFQMKIMRKHGTQTTHMGHVPFWITMIITMIITISHDNPIPGWWFGTWFSLVLGIIIPTDFHIFQRDRYTTNQIHNPTSITIFNHHAEDEEHPKGPWALLRRRLEVWETPLTGTQYAHSLYRDGMGHPVKHLCSLLCLLLGWMMGWFNDSRWFVPIWYFNNFQYN